jgi:ketosteroid isomerase-like protein
LSTNIENTRKAYAAFGAGDIATVMDLIAPDCVWHEGGRHQLSGDYVGHEQILGFFGQLVELTGGTFKAELTDVAESATSGLVTALVSVSGTRQGKTLGTRAVQLSRPDDAGRIAECWWFAEDGYAADEFFGSAQIVLPAQAARSVTPA